MDIKVISMDVDGTMVNRDKIITPKTKEALLRAQEKGCTLIIASGRPTSGLVDFAKELEMDKHHGLLVSYNGSRVTDAQTGEILFNQTMTVEECKAVLEHMKKFKVRPMVDMDGYLYVNNVYDCMILHNDKPMNIIDHERMIGRYQLCEKRDLAAFVDRPLNKILTAGNPAYLEENYLAMMEPFKDKLNCVFTAAFYFEFTAKGIDKAKALDAVLTPRGLTASNMVAFGDGHNDRTMIEYAGLGVAMDNAVDDLKAAADIVTLSNDHDGIAKVLEEYL